ncbi:MAG: LemA family protein [Acidobacteriota bacterium]|nr:LemA family protein [Acidobacteriota bacterium]
MSSSAALAVLVPLAGLVFLAIGGIFLYNLLVLSRNRTREAWSGVEVQLKRRSSLIPNLVETVRGYATHEHAVFSEVAQARGAMAQAAGPAAVAAADQGLSAALGRLMAVAENYPQLQAAGNFTQLQSELSDTEEKIAYARQFYNRNALDYNTRIQTFPGNQFAAWFGFEAADYYRAEEAAQADVKVQFTAV